ncbi:PREDICTED: lachesin-like [Wasmannia auropunctata]|uniref:lachesin-like n=1 Tax=Wasmannia auropunctata TaxID=64793 RepID=UPI0005F0AD73|nr:PREDICTED: lachesin-like [Wasmannia auropunctata]XP_011707110.1 PREDICTED: lachesin-like [Wasmannia auropunctata]XP_011707111.1 PREDICTED: lachesin-like [Wasmannia auropunctata]XP_011707112.1 PREDICTED: lachesin-like [Wasmannia auropunctata]
MRPNRTLLTFGNKVSTNNPSIKTRLSIIVGKATQGDFNTLKIHDARQEDYGIYICAIPWNYQTAFLEVVVPPNIISEETSDDLIVPEGSTAKLVCKARGYPKPKIVWQREDGAEIFSRVGPYKIKVKESSVEGEVLTLSNVTRDEMGIYLCIANNNVITPPITHRIELYISTLHCK